MSMTDKDHDLLIELKTAFDTKIGTLCTTITEFKKEIKDDRIELKEDIRELKNNSIEIIKRPKWSQLVVIFTMLISIVSGIIAYNFKQDSKSSDKINEIQTQVTKNSQTLKLTRNSLGHVKE